MVVGYYPQPKRAAEHHVKPPRSTCPDVSANIDQVRRAIETQYVERMRSLEEAPPLAHVIGSSIGGARRTTGRERLARLNEALDMFGLTRSKGQRNFHRNMTMAVIHKIFKDDFAENLDFLRDYFHTDVFKAEVLIVTPRRFGKCLGADTLVLMADGTTRRAADVRVGDMLVGDDGRARIVMNTCTGNAPMFRIDEAASTPSEDSSFTCNDDHLLVFEMRGAWIWIRRRETSIEVVRRSYVEGKLQTREHTTTFARDDEEGALACFERLRAEYSTRPTTTLRASDVHQALNGGTRLPAHFATPRRRVDHFPRESDAAALVEDSGVDVLDAAYYAGVWLGDGTSVRTNEITVCTRSSPELVEFLERLAEDNGLFANSRPDTRRPNVVALSLSTTDKYASETVGKRRQRSPNIRHSNPVQIALEALGVDSTKRISSTLLGASREVRLQVLAGLLDTDGYYKAASGYEIVQKRRDLALDCVRLARSLGLAARIHTRVINNDEYSRVNISGAVEMIPCRLPRKQAVPHNLGVDYERFSTSITPLGNGAYYGFQCAAVVDDADAERACTAIIDAYASGGDNAVMQVSAWLVLQKILLPSLANGASVIDTTGTRRYPGRFLLASHTVVHNTYAVAMFVAACAYALEGSDQSIFSTGRRASKKLLDLVHRFLCKLPGMKIDTKNVETITIRGATIDDTRKISSYPSKVRYIMLLLPPPPTQGTLTNHETISKYTDGCAIFWRQTPVVCVLLGKKHR